MQGGAAGDPRGLWGDPPAGTALVPRRLRAVGSPPGAAAVSRPPVLILQQLPGAAPAGPPSVRGDLMELMLIQTSQMHQLLMHGLAVAALMPLGVGPAPAPAQALAGPWQGEEEEEAVVFHHHYLPWPGPAPGAVPVRFLRSSPADESRATPSLGMRSTPSLPLGQPQPPTQDPPDSPATLLAAPATHPDPIPPWAELRGGIMDVLLLHGLLLLPLAALLLYRCSPSFQYLCKVALFNCWIVALATLLSPFAACRGRSVENMKLLRAALLPLKRFCGIRMRVRGSERLQLPGPFVIVCNHQASLDLMGMVEVIPERCVPIAKRELLYLGTVGWACWLSGIIFIDRHRRDAAIEVISRTASTMRRENLCVWVFPEGTRNPGKSMLPFKRGAFHLAVLAQVPIVPIVISPYWDFFSSKEKRFTSGTCTIQVLPRVETRGLSPKDVPELTESVRQAMAEALAEMSMSDHGDQNTEKPLLGLGEDRDSPQGQEDTAGSSK